MNTKSDIIKLEISECGKESVFQVFIEQLMKNLCRISRVEGMAKLINWDFDKANRSNELLTSVDTVETYMRNDVEAKLLVDLNSLMRSFGNKLSDEIKKLELEIEHECVLNITNKYSM